jgi:hypothetical protein
VSPRVGLLVGVAGRGRGLVAGSGGGGALNAALGICRGTDPGGPAGPLDGPAVGCRRPVFAGSEAACVGRAADCWGLVGPGPVVGCCGSACAERSVGCPGSACVGRAVGCCGPTCVGWEKFAGGMPRDALAGATAPVAPGTVLVDAVAFFVGAALLAAVALVDGVVVVDGSGSADGVVFAGVALRVALWDAGVCFAPG